jgi:hypothetical protein
MGHRGGSQGLLESGSHYVPAGDSLAGLVGFLPTVSGSSAR